MADTTPQRSNLEVPYWSVDSSGSDLSKTNTMGIGTDEKITQSFKDALKAKEDLAASLEQRYAKPNWFKIAAGFAKPQLGGFLASLGSATDAYGEQQEAQKAIAPTVARMRAEVAAQSIPFQQRMKQKELLEAWQATGKPMDATTYQKIVSYGKDSDIASSAAGYYEAAKSGQQIQSQAAADALKNPLANVQGLINFSLTPDDGSGNRIAELDKRLNANAPRGVDTELWNTMTRGDKLVEVANAAQKQAAANMSVEEQMRETAENAPKRLGILGSIRDLAVGTGIPDIKDDKGNVITGQKQMADLLGFFRSNNPIDAIARAAADGNLLGGKLAGFDEYAKQIKMTPEARDNFQVLVKLLAENQVALRGTSVNPTDQFSALQQMASPSVANSQRALITLTDMMALGENHNLKKYEFAKENKIPYGYLNVNPKFQKIQDEFNTNFRKIASGDPLMEAGSQYKVSSGSPSSSPKDRPLEKTFSGVVYYKQPDGSWGKQKAQP